MRTLHLTRDFPPRHCGGISTAVGGLVAALDRSGAACAVASFDDYRPAGTRTAVAPREPGALESSPTRLRIDDEDDLRRLETFARRFDPDLLQLHVDLLWEPAARLRERLDVPLLATLHVCHRKMLRVLAADRATASLAAQESVLREADLLVAPTRAAAEAVLADYPGVADRLRVAGFSVDRLPRADLAAMRLVALGRFGAVKGTDRLIALLPHLLSEPELTLEIVGGLPRNIRRDRRWRRRILDAAGPVADRVRLHGWLQPTRRDAVLSGARALLSTSRIETFGLAALEALAQGVPVCGYREPALVETAPRQLWLADAEPTRIAGAILECIRDRGRCREQGRAGREAIRPWSAVLDDWRRAYEAALGRFRG